MTEKTPSMEKVLATQVPAYVENLFASEVFATEATFFSAGNGTVSITFSSHRWDNSTSSPVQKRVVVVRLIMPIPGAQGLAAGLYDYLKKHGMDPAPAPSNPAQIQ